MDFTFGIITAGNNESIIQSIVDSIEIQKIKNYEIIIVGDTNIERRNTKIFSFDENVRKSWITKKKNIITQNASFDNIVFLHDYIKFEDGWYEGQLKKGDDFKIRMDKIINQDGSRFRDWCIWPHNNNKMDSFIGRDCLIPYSLTHLSKYMYISGSYWISKKQVMLEFPLNEGLSWGQGEDVEWSKQVREKYDFQMNEFSSVRILKSNKDKVFFEPNEDKIKILENINLW